MYKFINYLKKIGFKQLPIVNGSEYVYRSGDYKTEFKFEIDIENDNTNEEDIYIYGWAIEVLCNQFKDKGRWSNHWKHKIYNSKESAIDAINQMGGSCSVYTYRVRAMYSFKNNGWRNHIINKIIKEK